MLPLLSCLTSASDVDHYRISIKLIGTWGLWNIYLCLASAVAMATHLDEQKCSVVIDKLTDREISGEGMQLPLWDQFEVALKSHWG